MKKLLSLVLLAGLLSCSSDDGAGYSATSLVGLWHIAEMSADGESIDVNQCSQDADYLSLTATQLEYYRYSDNCSVADMDLGSWELQGNKIVLQSADPALNTPVIFNISGYSQNKMTLSVMRNGASQKIKFERQIP